MDQIIQIDQSDSRLDTYLAQVISGCSRAYIKKLIDSGRVTIAGKPVKAAWKTVAGETVLIDIPEPEPTEIRAQEIELDIVYEDEWLLVVNKPQGMVVHPAAGHRQGTLVNALLHYCQGQLSDINGVIRPGIVHRIDKDTSGLLLVVKDNKVHAAVADKIRRHEIKRTYQALVHGVVTAENGTIDAPIGRDPKHRQRMAVVASGKPSVTHFKVLERFVQASHLEVELESGRTHQIRVHLKYIGHPVLGDQVYATGRKTFDLNGQALHASELRFEHPVTYEAVHLTCPLPDYFEDLLVKLA